MTAYDKNASVFATLTRRGVAVTFAQAATLRKAERTLHRWAEQECGDGNDFASWAIERDETTGKAYKAVYPHNGPARRYAIADSEKGALKRVQAVCKAIGAHFYHQTDPRGVALYVAAEPLTDQTYSSRGVAINA